MPLKYLYEYKYFTSSWVSGWYTLRGLVNQCPLKKGATREITQELLFPFAKFCEKIFIFRIFSL